MLDKLAIAENVFSNQECEDMCTIVDEILDYESPQPAPRRLTISPKHERLRPYLLTALEQIKEISQRESLYISEYLVNIYSEGYHMDLHTDMEDGRYFFLVSAVLYVNDDYEGGEIVFPNLPMTHKPKTGDLVVFPSAGERFMHSVNEITSGKRYVIPIWTTPDKNKADTFIHP